MAGHDRVDRIAVFHGPAAIRAALAERGLASPRCGHTDALVWRQPDHLAIIDGARPALLAARSGTTGRDPFLLMAAMHPGTQASRLLATLLERLAIREDLPAALLVRADDAILTRALRQVGGVVPGAVAYPSADTTVIPLRTAAMARRIARCIGIPVRLAAIAGDMSLLALDIRSAAEETLPILLGAMLGMGRPAGISADRPANLATPPLAAAITGTR